MNTRNYWRALAAMIAGGLYCAITTPLLIRLMKGWDPYYYSLLKTFIPYWRILLLGANVSIIVPLVSSLIYLAIGKLFPKLNISMSWRRCLIYGISCGFTYSAVIIFWVETHPVSNVPYDIIGTINCTIVVPLLTVWACNYAEKTSDN